MIAALVTVFTPVPHGPLCPLLITVWGCQWHIKAKHMQAALAGQASVTERML